MVWMTASTHKGEELRITIFDSTADIFLRHYIRPYNIRLRLGKSGIPEELCATIQGSHTGRCEPIQWMCYSITRVYDETLGDSHRPEIKQRCELAHPATANSTRVPNGFDRERPPSRISPHVYYSQTIMEIGTYATSARTAEGRNIQQLQVVFIKI